MSQYVTPQAIAERYGVGLTTVYRWIDAGKLPALRVGTVLRVAETALTAFEQAYTTDNAATTKTTPIRRRRTA